MSSPISELRRDGLARMSGRDRLRDTLTKLGGEGGATGEPRRLEGATSDALLQAILTEIDETVLGRRLQFQADNRRFVLDASNRRVLYAVEPVDIDLSGLDDPAQAEALRTGLLSFLEGKSSVTVTASPSAAARESGTLGIAAAALSEAWSLETELSMSEPVSRVLARLFGEISGDVKAWMRFQDVEEIASDGPKEAVDALRRFIADHAPMAMQQGDLGLTPVEGPECIFMPPAARRDFPVLMAADGEERLLLQLEEGAEIAALQAFRTAMKASAD